MDYVSSSSMGSVLEINVRILMMKPRLNDVLSLCKIHIASLVINAISLIEVILISSSNKTFASISKMELANTKTTVNIGMYILDAWHSIKDSVPKVLIVNLLMSH